MKSIEAMRRHLPWMRHHRPDLMSGLVSGLAGGLAGAAAMHVVRGILRAATCPPEEEVRFERRGSAGARDVEAGDGSGGGVATVARRSVRALEHGLTAEPPRIAGDYGFGLAAGAAYGIAVEYEPDVALGMGVPFGLASMALADEGILPVLGLAASPKERSLVSHLESAAGFVAYGIVCELVRCSVRRLFR